MRYRIIKEVNLNEDVFYEVHFYKIVETYFFFRRWKWVPIYDHERRGEFWFTRPARYATFSDAEVVVNKLATKRTVAQEGEVDADDSYTC